MIAAPVARRALDFYHEGLRRYQANLVLSHHDLAEFVHQTENPIARRLALWRLRRLGRKVRQTIEELTEDGQSPYPTQQDRAGG